MVSRRSCDTHRVEHLAFERRHVNGVLARVYRDDEGAGYRPACLPAAGDADEPAWPYWETIDEAQTAADALAHPECTGAGCDVWTGVATGFRRP